jgi:hypothetical protein
MNRAEADQIALSVQQYVGQSLGSRRDQLRNVFNT